MENFTKIGKRILGDVYFSREAINNLVILCDEYNSRWPGSGDDRKACEFMVNKLKDYGLENPHMESIKLLGWRRGNSKLLVTRPIEKEIPCIALPHSIKGEVEAELIYLGDGSVATFEKRMSDIEGKIVIATTHAIPKNMNRRMLRSEKYNRSVLAGAVGFIYINHCQANGPPTGVISPIIPGIGVSYEDGNFLSRLLERKKRVEIRVETNCENLEVESWNVVADLPGSGETDETIICGAHYDAHDISQGALDDATGTVGVMEMARVLSKEREHLKRSVRFILFTSEETGAHGSIGYLNKHANEIDNIRFMLCLDGGGRSGRQGFMLNGWPNLEPLFTELSDDIGSEIPVWQGVFPGGDHWSFLMKGIPTACIGDPEEDIPWKERGFSHTIYDTVDKVDPRILKECIANSSLAILKIANTDEWPVTHLSEEQVNQLVKNMGHQESINVKIKIKEYLIENKNQLRPETKNYLSRLLKN